MTMSRPSHHLTPYEQSLLRIAMLSGFVLGIPAGIAIAILVWSL